MDAAVLAARDAHARVTAVVADLREQLAAKEVHQQGVGGVRRGELTAAVTEAGSAAARRTGAGTLDVAPREWCRCCGRRLCRSLC